jgi:hypothetical protein
MKVPNKKILRRLVILFAGGLVFVIILGAILIIRTWGRTLIQVDIHQNKDLIYLSTFAEPPQFAIWLENPVTKELKSVFVTHRVAIGDWEGKANVPVALPQWFRLFRGNGNSADPQNQEKGSDLVVSGATPKADYFSIRVEVKPESEWLCWIEMNLAGDFNDSYPEFNLETLREDEFSCGQPALLFRADIAAEEGKTCTPVLSAQAIWDDGSVRIEPVSEGVTSARNVFDTIRISVIRPKPKLIDKYKIKDY